MLRPFVEVFTKRSDLYVSLKNLIKTSRHIITFEIDPTHNSLWHSVSRCRDVSVCEQLKCSGEYVEIVLMISIQWRIQDFPEGIRQLPKWDYFEFFFAENSMKMKEFGPGGARTWCPLGSANAIGGSKW